MPDIKLTQKLKEVFSNYVSFVDIDKYGTIVVDLENEPKLKDLLFILNIISALPDYSGEYLLINERFEFYRNR